jgi:sulfide:quinone oxidoreductase
MVEAAGAELVSDELAFVDPERRSVHLRDGVQRAYGALVLALGAKAKPRYAHATTLDDRAMDATLHGIVQDVEGGYIQSLAFVAPGRMAWPMPIYELALMTAARAYDMGVKLDVTIVTPEDSPLAVFGAAASQAVAELLEGAGVSVMTSAYAEIPDAGQVIVNPGDRHLKVDRVIALPSCSDRTSAAFPLGSMAFCTSTHTGASSAWTASMQPATPPTSRSSRVDWQVSRPMQWPNRSRRQQAQRCRRCPLSRRCGECC